MKLLCLDSSTVVTFLLQEPGWQTVKRIVDSPDVDAVLPGPVLTEVIAVVRRRGNVSSPDQIAHTLAALGLAVIHPTDGDLVRAAELIELSASQTHPADSAAGLAGSLSLADALILAVTERLQCPVVTRDTYWAWMAEQDLLTVVVHTF